MDYINPSPYLMVPAGRMSPVPKPFPQLGGRLACRFGPVGFHGGEPLVGDDNGAGRGITSGTLAPYK